jgi:hypothetical protein
MKMEVKNCLTGVPAGVRDQPIAGIGYSFVFRDLGAANEQVAEQRGIRCADVLNRCHVKLRDDQNMDGGLGTHIFECQNRLIFVDDGGWNRAGDDLAK